MGSTGILGGTFNPPHIAHIRHALEVGEALALDRVLLSPAATPPHKPGRGLLPFDLRVALLREAVRGIPLLEVSTLEAEIEGPSYTFRVLEAWRRRNPEAGRPHFLLGVEDFAALGSWYRGRDLPQITNLVVVPRAGSDRKLFRHSLNALWDIDVETAEVVECVASPGAPTVAEIPASGERLVLPGGGRCTFLPVPRLDISASLVRRRWLEGRDIAGLVPEGVIHVLRRNQTVVDTLWQEGAGSGRA